MKQGFRQSMAWLHTWSGLLFGWLLFVIFACGTTAYFQEEVTRWMQPEVTAAANPAQAADGAARWLTDKAPDSSDWYITLPGKRSAVTSLFWAPAEGAPEGTRTEAKLDGAGHPVTARETAGGYFLYRFHFDLHYLPVLWARYLVGIAAMFMLVAIVSGIVTHKKIFADFFLLRFGKGQRSWLDAHNVTAVLALPFHLMITYTGLVTLETQFFPAPVAALYASADSFYTDAFPTGEPVERAGKPAPLAPLSAMVAQAQQQWNGAEAGYIHVANPGDAHARVTVSTAPSASMDARDQTLVFEGVSGHLLAPPPEAGAARRTEGVMIGLHAGRYADTALRWLYFLSGLGGTIMVGSGLVLWTVKRRAKLPDPARPHFGFRIVERTNIAVVTGFPIGLAAYFLANRVLPLHLLERADREVDCLFIAWGCVLLYALVRPVRRAWIELCILGALAFASVPVVSAALTGRNLFASLARGDWTYAAVELMQLAAAAGFALIAWKVSRARPAAQRPARRRQEAMA